MSEYGKKGGTSVNAGKKATWYYVRLPSGDVVRKHIFWTPKNPVGYAYQHEGRWSLATIAEAGDPKFPATYVQCPVMASAKNSRGTGAI